MIEIRRTTATDADELRRIRLAALQADPTAFGASYDDVVQFGPEVWSARASGDDGSATFLAMGDERAVGMVAGIEVVDRPGRVELVSMWTDPTTRGLGLGQQLVEMVVQWAAERGTPDVWLWVTRGNDAALRLYERCGFVLTEEIGVAASDPCREEVRMMRTGTS